MAEATAGVIVASGLVGDGGQVVKSWARKITKWFDRAKGLMVLKNLPNAPLEALVYGEDDVTPELLAALSLGGTPGLQLSMIALIKADDRLLSLGGKTLLSEVGPPEFKRGAIERVRAGTLMGGTYPFSILDDLSTETPTVLVHRFDMNRSSDLKMRLGGSGSTVPNLVVVGTIGSSAMLGISCNPLVTGGLLVRSLEDGDYYYCENIYGELDVSKTTITSEDVGLDVDRPEFGARMFLVSPRVLNDYFCFQRLCTILRQDRDLFVKSLGLLKVVKKLAEDFAARRGDEIPLLSMEHLQDVHCNPRRCTPSLEMPAGRELARRMETETEELPLRDRDAGLVLFAPMQELISDFVKNIESEAARRGNVGVRKRQGESNLIKSCIAHAVGVEEAHFAIFDDFRSSKLNIAVSKGCTAVYFPGFSFTVAFPEGHEPQTTGFPLTPACPFTRDLQESLPILLALAPKLAENVFEGFVKTLSEMLAKNPARALSPVNQDIADELCPGSRPCDALYLTDIFKYVKKESKRSNSTWGEASVAGILCQLGMNFSVSPGREGYRCFFDVCHEIWPPTCSGAQVVADCGVDISECQVRKVEKEQRKTYFLGNSVSRLNYELTGVPWDNLGGVSRCSGFLQKASFHTDYENVSIPVPCRVIGSGSSPPTVSPTVSLTVSTPSRR